MEIRTLCDVFYNAVGFRKPDHLKYKQDGVWRDISSDELKRAVEEFSMGLRALGLEKGERVAILSENRPEWAITDLACLAAGAVDAPIYATLTPAQVLYILNDSEARAIVVSSPHQVRKVQEVRAQAKHLQHVILVEEKREKAPPAFEQLKEQFRAGLLRDKYFALVKQLRADGDVEVKDPTLKAAVEEIEKDQQ